MSNHDEQQISVESLNVNVRGARLIPSKEAAQQAAQAAGCQLEIFREATSWPMPCEEEAVLKTPTGTVIATHRREHTEIIFESADGPLTEQINQLARLIVVMDRNSHRPPIGRLDITVNMTANQPPPEWDVAAQMSRSRTVDTGGGVLINQTTAVRRNFEMEAEVGTPIWDITASGTWEGTTVPDQQTMTAMIQATYTVAMLEMLPELKDEQHKAPMLLAPADQMGALGDVVAVELEYLTELCARYEMHRIPFGAVAAIVAVSNAVANANEIRPQLDLVEFEAPSLIPSAAARIDAAMERLDQEHEPYENGTTKEPDEDDVAVISIVAHTMAMAGKRHAIAHCADQMRKPGLAMNTRLTYRSIADLIINASVDHLDATVGQLEMENELTKDYPELARQLTDVINDADNDAMTAYHQACQDLDQQAGNDGQAGMQP